MSKSLQNIVKREDKCQSSKEDINSISLGRKKLDDGLIFSWLTSVLFFSRKKIYVLPLSKPIVNRIQNTEYRIYCVHPNNNR